MKTLNSFFLISISLLLACAATHKRLTAEKTDWPGDVRLCTGIKQGNYFKAGTILKQKAATTGFNINVVTTQGSLDNIERLLGGECEVAIVQADSLLYWSRTHRYADLKIVRAGALYREAAHLICRKDAEVKQASDLFTSWPVLPFGSKGRRILAGDKRSGHATTLATWGLEHRGYQSLQPVYTSPAEAVAKLLNDRSAPCLFHVSGLNSEYLAQFSNYPDKLKLVPFDDFDATDYRYRNYAVYDTAEIPERTYPGLQSGDLKLVVVKAIFIANADWVKHAPQPVQDSFFDAVISRKAEIQRLVADRLLSAR